MSEGSDNSRGDLGAWQKVSAAFASNIALGVAGLATHILSRFPRFLYSGHRAHLPIWVPDYTAFTSAHWAQRLISKLYSSPRSLGFRTRGSPLLTVEPSSFVWLQQDWGRHRVWSATPDEGQLIDTTEVVWPEAATSMPGSAESCQSTLPRAGGTRRSLSGHDIGAMHGLKLPWQGPTVFTPHFQALETARWPDIQSSQRGLHSLHNGFRFTRCRRISSDGSWWRSQRCPYITREL